jgi:hypothetical protein
MKGKKAANRRVKVLREQIVRGRISTKAKEFIIGYLSDKREMDESKLVRTALREYFEKRGIDHEKFLL